MQMISNTAVDYYDMKAEIKVQQNYLLVMTETQQWLHWLTL